MSSGGGGMALLTHLQSVGGQLPALPLAQLERQKASVTVGERLLQLVPGMSMKWPGRAALLRVDLLVVGGGERHGGARHGGGVRRPLLHEQGGLGAELERGPVHVALGGEAEVLIVHGAQVGVVVLIAVQVVGRDAVGHRPTPLLLARAREPELGRVALRRVLLRSRGEVCEARLVHGLTAALLGLAGEAVRVHVRGCVALLGGVALRGGARRPLRQRDLGLLLLLLLLFGLRAREHGNPLGARVGEHLGVDARVLLVGDQRRGLAVARADAGEAACERQLGLALLHGVGGRLGRGTLRNLRLRREARLGVSLGLGGAARVGPVEVRRAHGHDLLHRRRARGGVEHRGVRQRRHGVHLVR
eukprot:scaffold110093_cov48-Phaeocystis_antarctica.AAC.1